MVMVIMMLMVVMVMVMVVVMILMAVVTLHAHSHLHSLMSVRALFTTRCCLQRHNACGACLNRRLAQLLCDDSYPCVLRRSRHAAWRWRDTGAVCV